MPEACTLDDLQPLPGEFGGKVSHLFITVTPDQRHASLVLARKHRTGTAQPGPFGDYVLVHIIEGGEFQMHLLAYPGNTLPDIVMLLF